MCIRDRDNKWLIPLLNTTQQPALAEMCDRATREKLFIAGWTRAEKNDANDTRAIIQRLVEIRAQQAKPVSYTHLLKVYIDNSFYLKKKNIKVI